MHTPVTTDPPVPEHIQMVYPLVAALVRKTEAMMPIAHIFFTERGMDRALVVGLPFRSDDHKMVALMMLRSLCRQKQANAVLFLCEAWVYTSGGEVSRLPDIPINKKAPRQEAVIFNYQDHETVFMAQALIEKGKKGKRKLGPVVYLGEVVQDNMTHDLLGTGQT